MRQWEKQKNTGFTIVELLIVVVVIAILAAITIISYNGISGRSKAATLQSDLSQTAKALDVKKQLSTTGLYPSTLAEVGSKSDKLTYNYNSRSNTFCIDGKDGNTEYSIRGSTLTVAEGPCINHGMSLWLPMNGNTTDASGNENTVTVSGSPTVTTGANGRTDGAYRLSGSGQYFTVQNPDSIPTRTDRFTVSLWSNGLSNNGTDYSYMIHKGNSTSIGSSVFNIGTRTGSTQLILTSANGQHGTGSTGVSANGGNWRHIVLVYAGNYQTGYVDGNQTLETIIGSMTSPTTGTSLTIGAGAGGYRPLTGSIDDVRIYNRALTGHEVEELYNAGAQ